MGKRANGDAYCRGDRPRSPVFPQPFRPFFPNHSARFAPNQRGVPLAL
ncbi:MAG: hypothetical protein FWG68_05260 [Defluviitaleaceae bacterium]|nr:hypothetical protein [Defluviitaleaceae bacterium]